MLLQFDASERVNTEMIEGSTPDKADFQLSSTRNPLDEIFNQMSDQVDNNSSLGNSTEKKQSKETDDKEVDQSKKDGDQEDQDL